MHQAQKPPGQPPTPILYTGLYERLTASQRRAILELTMRRYVEAIHLEEYLEHGQGLTPGTIAFDEAHASHLAAIHETLSSFDRRTYVSAILVPDVEEEWVALASMRSLWGQRADVAVARSIGHVDSSIPTHTLLRSFQYPHLPGFDPNLVSEAEIFEASRLVTADRTFIDCLSRSSVLSESDLHAMLAAAFDELIVSAVRNGQRTTAMAGWIFNVKPRLAFVLKRRKGLNLIPLFPSGVEPTARALDAALDKPYFHLWHRELFKLTPDILVQEGMLAAVRHMATRDSREWLDCEISLPYLVVNDAEFERAVQGLESSLARRSYLLTRVTADA